jgi:hypothetical protein
MVPLFTKSSFYVLYSTIPQPPLKIIPFSSPRLSHIIRLTFHFHLLYFEVLYNYILKCDFLRTLSQGQHMTRLTLAMLSHYSCRNDNPGFHLRCDHFSLASAAFVSFGYRLRAFCGYIGIITHLNRHDVPGIPHGGMCNSRGRCCHFLGLLSYRDPHSPSFPPFVVTSHWGFVGGRGSSA